MKCMSAITHHHETISAIKRKFHKLSRHANQILIYLKESKTLYIAYKKI